MAVAADTTDQVMTRAGLLEHWQGHRRVSRRLIESYPDDQLFTFSVGGMRPFGVLVLEMLTMAAPTLRGIVTGEWETSRDRSARPKQELLRMWDESTEEINTLWPQIPPGRFQEVMTAFGPWKMPWIDLLLYIIDNEIHQRGQGYVYLRALGLEPPAFYDRS